MLPLHLWLAYVGTVVVIVYAPGPSVLLVSSHRMGYGAWAVAPTVAGDLTANVLQMLAAGLGLAALIQASAGLLLAIKWLGVACLIALGVSRFRAASQAPSRVAPPWRLDQPSRATLFRRGFLVSAANPKAVVFFASLFPLFLDAERPWFPQLTALALTFVLLDGSALVMYARLGGALRDWLIRRRKEHWEHRVSGTLLIGAGVGLAAKQL